VYNCVITIPNYITSFRFGLHFIALFLAFQGQFLISFLLFVVLSLLDKADGELARHYRQTSVFGRYFDGFVDKTVSLTWMAFFSMRLEYFPQWLFFIIFSRDMIGEGLRQYAAHMKLSTSGNILGKIKVVCQMVGTALCFLLLLPQFYQFAPVIGGSITVLFGGAALLGLLSLWSYVNGLLRK